MLPLHTHWKQQKTRSSRVSKRYKVESAGKDFFKINICGNWTISCHQPSRKHQRLLMLSGGQERNQSTNWLNIGLHTDSLSFFGVQYARLICKSNHNNPSAALFTRVMTKCFVRFQELFCFSSGIPLKMSVNLIEQFLRSLFSSWSLLSLSERANISASFLSISSTNIVI